MHISLSTRGIVLAGAVGATLTLAACGAQAATVPSFAGTAAGSSTSMSTMQMPAAAATTPVAAPVATNQVNIANFGFAPGTVMVKPGTTVTWTQQDEDQHTVTADDGSFGSSPLTTGQTFTHTFTTPGTYHYHCAIHQFMHGTVVVTNG
jgi:plastocyanin